MTDQITVDFNSRDTQGFLPASLRRLATLPVVGSIISAVDLEENHCLARVIAIGPASITLEPLWQTFATPEHGCGDAPDSTVRFNTRPRRQVRRGSAAGPRSAMALTAPPSGPIVR